jgi:glycosyltransferase involved in cell wall biosynthesis
MKIVFVYNKGRVKKLEKVRLGLTANEFYYGAIQLIERGWEVEFYEVDDLPRPSWGQKLADLLFKSHLLPTRVNGSLLMQVIKISKNFGKPNVVVATSTSLAFAFGLLKSLGLIRPPIIALCMTLIYHKHSWLRDQINGFVLRGIWTQLFGESELEGIRKKYRVKAPHISVNPYGVDNDFWFPEGVEEDYILSVGNDSRRDYDTLIRTAGKLDKPFIIVTAMKIPGPIPKNVTIIPGTKPSDDSIDDKLRDLIRRAACVVLPIKESIRPSGQSVCLQAMSCAKVVILSKTQGLWSNDILKHMENIIFVPPENENALFEAILKVFENSDSRKKIGLKAQETITTEWNINQFANRLEDLIKIVALNDK